MESRYNIYFAGQLLEGQDPDSVRARIAKLFKADEATLQRLFSGKSQLIKRACDKETALKYKQAIESAGAVPVIKVIAAESTTPAPEKPGEPMTAAQRIAALAAAPDVASTQPGASAVDSGAPDETEQDPGSIRLAPAGTEVLLPEERLSVPANPVSAPDLDVGSAGQRLSEVQPPPPPAPDTSHLSAGPVGEAIPTLATSTTAAPPDTSAIELSPDGTDLSDCAAQAPAAPELDLSGIDLAPVGSDVLEKQYRKKHDTPAPSTDHLAVKD